MCVCVGRCLDSGDVAEITGRTWYSPIALPYKKQNPTTPSSLHAEPASHSVYLDLCNCRLETSVEGIAFERARAYLWKCHYAPCLANAKKTFGLYTEVFREGRKPQKEFGCVNAVSWLVNRQEGGASAPRRFRNSHAWVVLFRVFFFHLRGASPPGRREQPGLWQGHRACSERGHVYGLDWGRAGSWPF